MLVGLILLVAAIITTSYLLANPWSFLSALGFLDLFLWLGMIYCFAKTYSKTRKAFNKDYKEFDADEKKTDPGTVSKVIRTVNSQKAGTSIRDEEEEPKGLDSSKIEEVVATNNTSQQATRICIKCDNKHNLADSMFCNQCGSALSSVCAKCGNSNPSGAMFCGQCGSKFGGS